MDNYLHEAAQADKPASAAKYDPEGNGTLLESLGVHEHWNNPKEKKYSRNLGAGGGIELAWPWMRECRNSGKCVYGDRRFRDTIISRMPPTQAPNSCVTSSPSQRTRADRPA